MKRTQIYLPEEMVAELKLAAQRLDTSMSALIRQAIKQNLKKIRLKPQGLNKIIGLVDDSSLPTDVSQKIDQYLFGSKAAENGTLREGQNE